MRSSRSARSRAKKYAEKLTAAITDDEALMWMTDYIHEIQRLLITKYGFKAGDNGCPQDVPDGEYPMTIKGKRDNVRIVDGKISCCNFEA